MAGPGDLTGSPDLAGPPMAQTYPSPGGMSVSSAPPSHEHFGGYYAVARGHTDGVFGGPM